MAGYPKLGDVAKRANLSPAAVSRYLNGYLKLPPQTARRIDHVVQALGYQPHAHARSLSRGRSDVIGLLLPEISNPFYARLAAAVEASADARGLGVMLFASLNKPAREIDYLVQLRRNLVDGLLIATNHEDGGALAKTINDSPGIVLVDEDVEASDVPKVFCDNRQGGRLAAEHLLGFGHAAVAYVGGPRGLMSVRERGAGFSETIRAAGGRVAAECFDDFTRRHGEVAARHILDHHPDVTAIFAGSDEILIGVLGVARDRGLVIGGDLSLVSFDDVAPLDLLDPPISAIRQPVEDIGRRALERMLDPGLAAGTECLPVELMARASVVPPRLRRTRRRVTSPRDEA